MGLMPTPKKPVQNILMTKPCDAFPRQECRQCDMQAQQEGYSTQPIFLSGQVAFDDQTEPIRVFFRLVPNIFPEPLRVDKFPFLNLRLVHCRFAVKYADKKMVKLMFRQAIFKFSLVNEGRDKARFQLNAHFFKQATTNRVGSSFPGLWVTTAGIRPQTSTLVFVTCALL